MVSSQRLTGGAGPWLQTVREDREVRGICADATASEVSKEAGGRRPPSSCLVSGRAERPSWRQHPSYTGPFTDSNSQKALAVKFITGT